MSLLFEYLRNGDNMPMTLPRILIAVLFSLAACGPIPEPRDQQQEGTTTGSPPELDSGPLPVADSGPAWDGDAGPDARPDAGQDAGPLDAGPVPFCKLCTSDNDCNRRAGGLCLIGGGTYPLPGFCAGPCLDNGCSVGTEVIRDFKAFSGAEALCACVNSPSCQQP